MDNIMVRRQPKLSLKARQLISAAGGVAVSFAVASLLHFLWNWSGQLLPVALIASVNESVWEHVKILAWPFLAWSSVQYVIVKPDPRRLVVARTAGLIVTIVLTICFFYIYTGILGFSVLWIDIACALLWLAAGEIASLRVQNSRNNIEQLYPVAVAVLSLIVIMLLCFTVSAPQLGLFLDPENGIYGIGRFRS